MGLLCEIQEGLLPLSLIDSTARFRTSRPLSKKIRNRRGGRRKLDLELNQAIGEVNGLGKGLIGGWGSPQSMSSRTVSSCSTAPAVDRKALLGLKQDRIHFQTLDKSTPATDASPFGALP